MDWNAFTAIRVQIEHADMATLNKVRAWARRNNASVHVKRYAKDAYEGYVSIASPWNEPRAVVEAKAVNLRTIL